MKTIYFVRHGQTLLNQFRRMQGWVDSPLTEKGEAQAKGTAVRSTKMSEKSILVPLKESTASKLGT